MPSEGVRTRVAPSPTGDPHMGTLYAALFCKAFAEKHNGTFVLRIEDTDRTRYVPEAVEALYDALHWAHLDPDESPLVGGPYGPYVQSERLPIYHELAQRLVATGHAYPCFCTPERLTALRADQEARREPTRYDRHCLYLPRDEVQQRLRAGEPHTIRLRIPDHGPVTFHDVIRGTVSFETSVLTDHILLKSDGYPTSHLAIPADDHSMHISHVIRAEEWLSSVPYYVLIYRAFEWVEPIFAHLSVLRNADRSKMSKRKNNTSVRWYREHGFLPEAVLNFLALLGWSHPQGEEIFSYEEFRDLLTLERIVKSGPIFDLKKLEWMNGVYIRRLSTGELAHRLQPFLSHPVQRETLERILPLVQERLKTLCDINDALLPFLQEPDPLHLPFADAIKRLTLQDIRRGLELLYPQLAALGTPDALTFERIIRSLAAELGWKAGDLFMAVRIAVTGTNASPPLYDFCDVIGWPHAFKRLQSAIESLPAH